MSRSPITRRVHIEFISKDTVVITNAYLQKTFHLDKMFVPGKAIYIDLVRMNTTNDPNNNTERFIASITDNKNGSFGLDIFSLPDYGSDWQRVGLANMGRFSYYMKGGIGANGQKLDPQVVQAVEGAFSVKIIY